VQPDSVDYAATATEETLNGARQHDILLIVA
jgi:hypothetical protein